MMKKSDGSSVKIIETPRDAIQGLKGFVPTEKKISYINKILRAGFDTVEVGSFVSPEAIPQMKDTEMVLKSLDYPENCPGIMVLLANVKGMERASQFEVITDISYPFSASPSFLMKNINRSVNDSVSDIDKIQNTCVKSGKNLVVYITMAFGNPYNDVWSVENILRDAELLVKMGVKCIPLSDITGEADEERIFSVYSALHEEFPDIEFGLHLHAEKLKSLSLVDSAWKAGCRRFDTVIGGYGGCPMTGKELLANLDTISLIKFLKSKNVLVNIDSLLLNNTNL